MLGGSLLNVAEVLKGLLLLQIEKPLSFREKKMLDRARHMLVTELTMARRMPELEAVSLLQKALGESQSDVAARVVKSAVFSDRRLVACQ